MPLREMIDWSECPLVETKPGVHSGATLLRGTRLPVAAIIDNFGWGLGFAEIAEQFEVPQSAVREIVEYAESRHTKLKF